MSALNLIGTFDLDPSRVIDIVITVFQQNPSDHSFLPLLVSFDSSLFPHIFGFKFKNILEKCQSLCEVAALCIKAGLFSVENLWGYLKPGSLHICFVEHEELAQTVKRSLDVIVINSDTSSKEKDMAKLFAEDLNNQKLGLVTELIKVNHWDYSQEILNRFQGKLVMTSYPGLIEALCQMIEWVIDPVYQDLPKPLPTTNKIREFPKGCMKQLTSLSEVSGFLSKILPIIEIYIGASEDTFIKVCKVLQHLDDKTFVIYVLEHFLLPGLSLAGANVVKILWTTLQDLNYNARYQLYRCWKTYNKGIVLVKQSQTV